MSNQWLADSPLQRRSKVFTVQYGYASPCVVCGEKMVAGEQVLYVRKTRTVGGYKPSVLVHERHLSE